MQDAVWTNCGLAAWGVARIPWNDIARWRQNLGHAQGLDAAAPLRVTDEQTVLAVAAVLDACARAHWALDAFSKWGVLAAPNFIGRVRFAQGICRYQKQGARGVSPLLIPTLSLHSPAASICMILGCHGPTFGIGGGSDGTGEALLGALTLFEGQPCPGIWAVMTAFDPEPIPDGKGQILDATTGIGVAMALTPQAAEGEVRLVGPDWREPVASVGGSVAELASFLDGPGCQGVHRFPIRGGCSLEVIPNRAQKSSLLPAA